MKNIDGGLNGKYTFWYSKKQIYGIYRRVPISLFPFFDSNKKDNAK